MKLWKAFTRTKRNEIGYESKLARVLNLSDLIALGVGSTLGLGVYVLAGSVAYQQAGPAVVLSFLVAAVASAFSGLCYAEFAARVPKAGSAYVYSYVTVGEFVAFTIGWNLILEYVIGTSSVARGLSGYLDSLLDKKMSQALRSAMPINVDFLAEYPDFFSFAMILVLTGILAYGVKESSFFNKIFTAVNLVTIAIVIVAGGIYSKPENWSIPKENIPEGVRGGEGGFAPYGVAGIMAGAAKCFYGFVGFDCVATTGEEAKNPQRNIPLSIVVSLIIIFLAYFGVSTVLTMMWPYYDQNPEAPFPYVFDAIGLVAIKWIVTIGAIFALCTSLLGAMFPLPRVLYAMANDGIIYKYFKTIHPFTKTPLKATILSGLLAAAMALIFDLHQLIDMMSIGTLLAYTIVAVCVLVLRYQDDGSKSMEIDLSVPTVIRQIFNLNFIKTPNSLSSAITKIGIVVVSVIGAIIFGIMIAFDVSTDNPWTIVVIVLCVVAILLIVLSIARQPVADASLTFKVPLVPYIPCFSSLINLYLMFQLDGFTWIRFIVWIAVGYVIYFTYGIRKSVEGDIQKQEGKVENNDIQISTISDFRMPAGEKSSKSNYAVNS